jgi:hypothetical protein
MFTVMVALSLISLLAPANQMSYDTQQFYNSALCGHGMVAAAERQPWLDRLHRRDVGSVPRKAK